MNKVDMWTEQHPIHHIAHRDPHLERLMSHARQFVRLDRLLQKLLPSELKNTCQAVCWYEDGLVIFAQSGAVAARLRALSSRILQQFAEKDVQIAALKIKVRPVDVPFSRQKSLMLSERARGYLEAAADRVTHERLRQQLKSFAVRPAAHESEINQYDA